MYTLCAYESSEHRLARARAIAKVHNINPDSYDSFYDILGDQSDSAFPLYRDASGADNLATAATVLFALSDTFPKVQGCQPAMDTGSYFSGKYIFCSELFGHLYSFLCVFFMRNDAKN